MSNDCPATPRPSNICHGGAYTWTWRGAFAKAWGKSLDALQPSEILLPQLHTATASYSVFSYEQVRHGCWIIYSLIIVGSCMLVLGRLRTTYVFSRILYYTILYHSVIYHLPYCNIAYRKDHYAHVVFGARSHTHTYIKQVSDVLQVYN